jgi:GAF domain-containing protein
MPRDCCTLGGRELAPIVFAASGRTVHRSSAGSCGTAAWRNAPVIVDNIAQDPLWEEYRHLVLPLGYQACWSTPIRNSQHQPIGTFAYFGNHGPRLRRTFTRS